MALEPCLLRGISWNHSRAFPPLVATAQRFEELNPGVIVQWEKRSLHDFGHADISELARMYDLVVVDHPWCGFAVDREVFVNLQNCLDSPFREDLERNSVGASFASYAYRGTLVALPIDAACPAASYRPDLIHPEELPRTWDDVISLARGKRVVLSGFHVDMLLHLVMLAVTLNPSVFISATEWTERDTCRQAMEMLHTLVRLVPQACLGWNPIAVYEAMTQTDDYVYCPFAYTYSNFSRRNYARNILRFADLVEIPGRGMLRSVLGGTGIALSQRSPSREQALAYMVFTASGEIQRSIYNESGGQPAHCMAWTDDRANFVAGDFFRLTLRSMENAYMRPRYNGYLYFQEEAGQPLLAWLRGDLALGQTIEEMNRIYRESRGLSAIGQGGEPSQEN